MNPEDMSFQKNVQEGGGFQPAPVVENDELTKKQQ